MIIGTITIIFSATIQKKALFCADATGPAGANIPSSQLQPAKSMGMPNTVICRNIRDIVVIAAPGHMPWWQTKPYPFPSFRMRASMS
jgi:hypothetical protein